ncbi:MAG TPA: ferredoxin--NADP reductase [Bacteroidales bacterium]|nr:ferredoxin--NADP reductase [Bacteroidales bacterium]
MNDNLNAIVTQVIQVSPIMKILRIAPDGWKLPVFKPGQFVSLFLPGSVSRCPEATEEFDPADPNKLIKRAYSISSSSKSNEYLEFYITLVHSGALTPRIFNLKVGDRIGMGTKIVGMFTLDQVPKDANIVLIATGTGVAPYMSMLRSDALKTDRRVCVIHGAANSWDLGYSSELRLLESMTDKFSYVPTITHPQNEPTEWKGETRFIQDMLADRIIEKTWGIRPTPENTHVFICGNPKMIKSVKAILEERGFKEGDRKTPGQIHIEKF